MPEAEPRQPHRPLHWPELIFRLQRVSADAGQPVYVVGGAVRDALLGRPVHDVDLALASGGIRLARRIANELQGDFYVLDGERDVGRALLDSESGPVLVDVARFRGQDLPADLVERDFTVNAMAVDLCRDVNLIIDPTGGEADLRAKVLRQCSSRSLRDDPLRALRAIRLAAGYGFRIEPETRQAMAEARGRLADVSAERLRDEFWRLLALPQAVAALRAADVAGLLHAIVPEVRTLAGRPATSESFSDRWQQTLNILTNLQHVVTAFGPRRDDQRGASFGPGMLVIQLDRWRPQLQRHVQRLWPGQRPHRALLLLAAMYIDTGNPEVAAAQVRARARALRLSNAESERLAAMLRWQDAALLLEDLSDLSLYRFWRDAGSAGLDACLLAAARVPGEAGVHLDHEHWLECVERLSVMLQARFERHDSLLSPPALLDGHVLMRALQLPPGPQIGILLEQIREAQVAGEVRTADEALSAARNWLVAQGQR